MTTIEQIQKLMEIKTFLKTLEPEKAQPWTYETGTLQHRAFFTRIEINHMINCIYEKLGRNLFEETLKQTNPPNVPTEQQ